MFVHDPARRKSRCEKLCLKFFGPFRILEKLSPVNYRIDRKKPDAPDEVVHVEGLSPFYERE